MIINLDKLNIYVKPGITDMRKQINGLSILVQEDLEKDPFSGSLFMFCNRNRKLLKILYWDQNGFCHWLKRLEKDKFPWPQNETAAQDITRSRKKIIWQEKRTETHSREYTPRRSYS